ncbi:MAG: hypothetical protein K9N23_03815 [Akkermansiaceae bacterium]|nr:hypothetical protein [Akkermansiaceae bacterium]
MTRCLSRADEGGCGCGIRVLESAWINACGRRMAGREFVLTECYLLLRNPAVLPLGAAEAVAVVEQFRRHP